MLEKAISAVFGDMPTLETDRLILRPIRETDATDAYRYTADLAVVRHVPLQQATSIADALAFIRSITGLYRQGQAAPWGVTLKAGGRHIGVCGFESWHPRADRGEIGFMFARDCWGCGYAREAVGAAIAFGFERMRLHRLEARTGPANTAARRLLGRLGFRYEGTLRESMRWKGAYHDLMMFALLEPEWAAARFPAAGASQTPDRPL